MNKFMTFEEIKFIRKQLISQCAFLQRKGIVHGDIKPDNIIVKLGNDLKYQFILIDFGNAKILNTSHPNATLTLPEKQFKATVGYTPPELKCENGFFLYYPFKFDVYSLAISLLKLMGISKDKKGNFNKIPYVDDLFRMMLEENPLKRVDFFDLEEKVNIVSISNSQIILPHLIDYDMKKIESKKLVPDYWENLNMSNIYLDLGQFEESNEKLMRCKRILEKMEGLKKFEISSQNVEAICVITFDDSKIGLFAIGNDVFCGVDVEMFRLSLKMGEIN